jgi:hypothetical protein
MNHGATLYITPLQSFVMYSLIPVVILLAIVGLYVFGDSLTLTRKNLTP